MTDTAQDASTGVADNFSTTAGDYDAVVRHNIDGARRLAMSFPDGEYRSVLDVGCGTGWASLAIHRRFPGITHLTGIDPAEGMLAEFRKKVDQLAGVSVDLRTEDVMAMGVEPESFDAVISSMAMHWFPDKPGAAVAMAAALKPGGVIGILQSGAGGDNEFREILRSLDPPAPPAWDAAFDFALRDVDEMRDYLVAAGLEPIDIWMERRLRRTPIETYLERMRVVASHIMSGSSSADEVAQLMECIADRAREVSGPRGFEYTFTKLFAIARKPA